VEEIMLSLYSQRLNDVEISKRISRSPAYVWQWRKKYSLPSNGKPGGYQPVPMETVLTEDQCAEIRRFFAALLVYTDRHKDKKPDIGAFMRKWNEIGGPRNE
jgi:hypothetical protein